MAKCDSSTAADDQQTQSTLSFMAVLNKVRNIPLKLKTPEPQDCQVYWDFPKLPSGSTVQSCLRTSLWNDGAGSI